MARAKLRIAAAVLLAALVASPPLRADTRLQPVTDPLTQKVCGECHLAFPPGLLPARSWAALVDGAADHFGEDLALPPDQAAQIRTWLSQHAGAAPGGRGLREYMRWVAPQGAPTRITENPAFLRKHDFAVRVWQDPKVLTKSNCLACHAGAAEGWFDDD